MPVPSKYLYFYFTVPPAVSTLTEQTATIAENPESVIDMSNLMLKYIPPETLFYRNMALMQKALYFASALNKGSYAYNGFGHNIEVDDFFEQEGTEPLRKKARVVKSVPLAVGKKPPTATKVARKTQPSAAASTASTSDPDYQPPEGAPEGDSDGESVSDTEDVTNPLIDQDICIYDCYTVDITDAQYNTKTGIKTCPNKNQCYCGQEFGSPQEFKTHEKQHAGQVWACFECNKESKGNDKHSVYKHYRTQHDRRHLHQCTFATCSIDDHPYGNDEQYTVWWHMQEDHGLQSPLGCPKCNGTFHSKQTQQKYIPNCPGIKDKFGPKQTPYAEKRFKCDQCAKKYTTQAALLQHKKVHKGTNKKYVCSLCGKALSSTTALHKHEKIHQSN